MALYENSQNILKRSSCSTEEIFTYIYENNIWGDKDSRSGTGSNLKNTTYLRQALPSVFKELKIASMLDIPCGDFFWMKEVDLTGITYIGADIVKELVRKNNESYADDSRIYIVRNIVKDQLPTADLILCRDCLVHFSYGDIFAALFNIIKSNAKYLMTTVFPNEKGNLDTPTGGWRPINFSLQPFNLPDPLYLLNEHSPEAADKSLGLWEVNVLRDILKKRYASA
jgi:2-polyprenyl-3-methyl-5-hydroxy-6-metoxy-1,4-benzoquinol methylase